MPFGFSNVDAVLLGVIVWKAGHLLPFANENYIVVVMRLVRLEGFVDLELHDL